MSIGSHYTLLDKHVSQFPNMIIHIVDCQLGASVAT